MSLPEPVHAMSSNPDSSDIAIHIHEASAEEQSDYSPINIEGPDGTSEAFWVGDSVMTIAPSQVQKLTVETDNSGRHRFVVHVDDETEQEFTAVTRDAEGRHLAFRLDEEFFMAPQIFEPIRGGRIVLFNVPGDLLGRFTEEVWEIHQ